MSGSQTLSPDILLTLKLLLTPRSSWFCFGSQESPQHSPTNLAFSRDKPLPSPNCDLTHM
jgi:hypothetical protein